MNHNAEYSVKAAAGHPLSANIPPANPTMIQHGQELLAYLAELDHLQAETRARLLGREPLPSDPNGLKEPDKVPCLEHLIAHACSAAACLVGEQKSILARI